MDVERRADDSTALSDAIRAEIERNGPITFARFMETALTDPAHGYYARSGDRPTRTGDFLTAPELHPIFGRTIAAQVEQMWQLLGAPEPFVVREYGAGSGALFVSIADGLERLGSPLAEQLLYEPIDFARQRELIVGRLRDAGRSDQLVPISERGTLRTGVVIANEYLDALPVHRVIRLGDSLHEIYVDWRDGKFTDVSGPLGDTRVIGWFTQAEVTLEDNQRAEANIAMLDWIDEVATGLDSGYVLVIDYGSGERDLYDALRRPTGTIRAFAGQRVSSDVLSDPGSRDITSNVNFDKLDETARRRGLAPLGRRKSNEFLMACGLDAAYQAARAESDADWDAATNLRSAIQRLLDPNALGGYLVDVLAKNAPGDSLRGFAPLPPRR